MYHYVPYLVVTYSLFFIIFILMVYAVKNRTILGARNLFMTLVLVELWIAAQGLEMAAAELHVKIFWANIQYIPIMFTPISYLVLSLKFTRRDKLLKQRQLIVLLAIIPLAVNVLLWFDGTSELIRQNVYLNTSGLFPTVGKTYGPVFWLLVSYNYAVIFFTMLNIALAFREKISLYRKQNILLFTAMLFPIVANLLQISGLNPFNVDLTPSFFGFSALIITLGIFRYSLFDIVPIARSIIIQEMNTGIIVLDMDGRLLDINPAAKSMLRLTSDNLTGQPVENALSSMPEVIHAFGKAEDSIFEISFEGEHGSSDYEVSFSHMKNADRKPIGWLMLIYDISERKNAERVIQHAALHDSLTGLPNRNFFQILFSQELGLAKVRGDALIVAFLDLDNFKIINDTYGHEAGDRVLSEISGRLKEALRDSDIIARIGGDEIAIVFPGVGSAEKINIIENKLMRVFDQEIELTETSVQILASVGFAVYPRDGDNMNDLLNYADKAMYSVKGSRKRNDDLADE
jgi:diguanylate cyclase (GGDEF)-like protein/PAS domain S-box-containing protein